MIRIVEKETNTANEFDKNMYNASPDKPTWSAPRVFDNALACRTDIPCKVC
jgi:hypothetical protein